MYNGVKDQDALNKKHNFKGSDETDRKEE